MVFFLENVPGLLEVHSETFEAIIWFLTTQILDAHRNQYYDVDACVLDTRTHGGLPQSRRRVYIVGNCKTFPGSEVQLAFANTHEVVEGSVDQ